MILIIGCSVLKKPIKGPAREVYCSPIVQLGIEFAILRSLHPLILSGRYGIIEIDSIIDPYDERLDGPYIGPWPAERGFWLGSTEYFANAPDHISRLLPEGMSKAPHNWTYGQQKSWLMRICRPHRYGLKK